MDREELEWMAEELTTRIQGINNWIMENPNTDPNMYEMTECLMEFGNICSLFRDSLGNTVSNYDVIKEANLPKLSTEVRKMLKLRGVKNLDKNEELTADFSVKEGNLGFEKVDSEFFEQNKDAQNFLNDIYYQAITGVYVGEGTLGKEGFKEKEKVFTKIAAINLYVWQESKKDLNFSYDNAMEYSQVKGAFERLQKSFEEVGVYYYEGGESINNMFNSIKEYSKDDLLEEENISSMQM